MKYHLPCPHELDRSLKSSDTRPSHYPLTAKEAEALLKQALVVSSRDANSIQIRLVQAIVGLECPYQADGPVADKIRDVNSAFMDYVRTGGSDSAKAIIMKAISVGPRLLTPDEVSTIRGQLPSVTSKGWESVALDARDLLMTSLDQTNHYLDKANELFDERNNAIAHVVEAVQIIDALKQQLRESTGVLKVLTWRMDDARFNIVSEVIERNEALLSV